MARRDKSSELEAEDGLEMSADGFRAWRKGLGLKQKEAAEALGLKKRMIQYYETGARGSKKVDIPKSVRLACYALTLRVRDYDGERIVQAADRAETEGAATDGADPTAALSEAAE